MSLINCKVELKLKSTNYYVVASSDTENANSNSSNVIFTTKDTKLYVSIVTYQQKTSKSYHHQNFLAKDLKDNCIGRNIKQKLRIKIRQTSTDISFNQIL